MFLELGHTKLPIYSITRKFVLECYRAVKLLPPEEKFVLSQQIRRAALSVHLNFAEGSSKHSNAERKRYYEIARSSIVEIDSALDVAEDLGYLNKEILGDLGESMKLCFKQLSNLINSIG